MPWHRSWPERWPRSKVFRRSPASSRNKRLARNRSLSDNSSRSSATNMRSCEISSLHRRSSCSRASLSQICRIASGPYTPVPFGLVISMKPAVHCYQVNGVFLRSVHLIARNGLARFPKKQNPRATWAVRINDFKINKFYDATVFALCGRAPPRW